MSWLSSDSVAWWVARPDTEIYPTFFHTNLVMKTFYACFSSPIDNNWKNCWPGRKAKQKTLIVCKNLRLKACLCLCTCVFKFFSETLPLGQLKPKFMRNHHGIGEESLINWFRTFVVLHRCQPLGCRFFSRDITNLALQWNLALQCKALSLALKIEKLKAPLFPGP